MLAIKTILFPTDFSERAESAFRLACALARDYDARLLICHVNMPATGVYGEMGVIPPPAADMEESLRRKLLSIRPEGDVAFEHYFMVGDPAWEIVELARVQNADLIVMGTHGRRGLGRLLMGSVAERVVRSAECPVVTLRSQIAAAKELPEACVTHSSI